MSLVGWPPGRVLVTSIERTAYPRFRRLVGPAELAMLTPTVDERVWACESTRSDGHRLALLVGLECFQRLCYFPAPDEVPVVVVALVCECLGLAESTELLVARRRTVTAHRTLVRERVGVICDQERARAVAAAAVRAAAVVHNQPADLINVALEALAAASLELPAFSTLDRLVGRLRSEANRVVWPNRPARVAACPLSRANMNGCAEQYRPVLPGSAEY